MRFNDFIFGKAFIEDDFITQDKYLLFAEKNSDWLQYAKTDCIKDISEWKDNFIWRGKEVDRFFPERSIVVIGHSDLSFKQKYADLFIPDYIHSIFAVNADCFHKNVYGLPHGLTNDCDDTPNHRILGNTDILCDVLSREKSPKHLVYMNFNIDTDKFRKYPIRESLWNCLSNIDFIYRRKCTSKNVNLNDRKQYLQDVYDSKFMLCPEGNGIDTVRTWEALYCRTIPIVMRTTAMRYFEELPILWIDDWEKSKDRHYLEEEYNRIMNSEWNLDMLKIGYWTKKIEEVYKDILKLKSNDYP